MYICVCEYVRVNCTSNERCDFGLMFVLRSPMSILCQIVQRCCVLISLLWLVQLLLLWSSLVAVMMVMIDVVVIFGVCLYRNRRLTSAKRVATCLSKLFSAY